MKIDVKNKILTFLKGEGINPKHLVELMIEATTIDGVVIGTDAEAWAEGVNCYIVVDGEQVPAESGEYALEDGTIVVVDNGTVAAITAPEAPEEMSEFNAEKSYQALSEEFNTLKSLLTEMLESQKLEATELAAAKMQESEIEKLKAEVQKLNEQPAAVSLKKESVKQQMAAPKKNSPKIAKVAYHLQNS